MHDEKLVQRFIELRASGRSYNTLVNELNVSKPTLINWSRKHQFEIQNLKAIEMEAIREKWLTSVNDQVNALGEHLRRIEAELAKREPADLTTAQLFALARTLRRQIEKATGGVTFTSPVAEIPGDEYHDRSRIGRARGLKSRKRVKMGKDPVKVRAVKGARPGSAVARCALGFHRDNWLIP